jgi:steroid delta-isomerase-like uncharacterized protein
MEKQQNMVLTKKLYEELFNKDNLKICDELIANHVKLIDPASPHNKEGLKAFKEQQNLYIHAFPKNKVRIDEMFEADDKVVVRWTCQGTQKGEFLGIAPSNKAFKITGISIYRFANGKITEIWQNWDRLALLEQIGEIAQVPAFH